MNAATGVQHERVAKRRRRGSSLLELSIAMVVLAITSLGSMAAFMNTSRLNDATSDEVMALNAIRDAISEVQAFSKTGYIDNIGQEYSGIDGMIARYQDGGNATFTSNLLGQGPNAAVGTIIMHLDETAIPAELGGDTTANSAFTDANGYQYGPLNLDENPNSFTDLSNPDGSDYAAKMVPVEIQLQWQNAVGTQTMRRFFMIERTVDPADL